MRKEKIQMQSMKKIKALTKEKQSTRINKKADAPILIMIMLILALSLFTLFQFSKNKRNIDTLTLDYGALDLLYDREAQLQNQLTALAETAAISTYDKVMNTVIFVSEEGKFIEEVNDEVLNKEFKEEFVRVLKEGLDEYLRSHNELKEEMIQIKELLDTQPLAIEFQNNEAVFLNFDNIKITLVSFDKQGRETFRGIYTSKISTNISLTRLGLSKVSFDYFRNIYLSCKEQDEKIPCLNLYLPQFNIIFKYSQGYKPGTPQGTLTDPTPYNLEITSLDLTTKRKFLLGKNYKPINFKVVADVKEI